MAFLDFVHQRGLYTDDAYAHQQEILSEYKAKRLPYDLWVEDWGRSWALGLQGREFSQLSGAAQEFFETFQVNIYPQARPLVEAFRAKGFRTVIVSAGVFEIVDVARQHLGADLAVATRASVEDGIYSGQLHTRLHLHVGKAEVVEEMMQHSGPPIFAFGDSSGDIGMLQLAQIPVCLNPNLELSAEARRQGWAQMPIEDALAFVQGKLREFSF